MRGQTRPSARARYDRQNRQGDARPAAVHEGFGLEGLTGTGITAEQQVIMPWGAGHDEVCFRLSSRAWQCRDDLRQKMPAAYTPGWLMLDQSACAAALLQMQRTGNIFPGHQFEVLCPIRQALVAILHDQHALTVNSTEIDLADFQAIGV